jgi:hypothetical protein
VLQLANDFLDGNGPEELAIELIQLFEVIRSHTFDYIDLPYNTSIVLLVGQLKGKGTFYVSSNSYHNSSSRVYSRRVGA